MRKDPNFGINIWIALLINSTVKSYYKLSTRVFLLISHFLAILINITNYNEDN